MTQVSITYDEKNTAIRKLLDAAVVRGAVKTKPRMIRVSAIEKSLQDAREGRVYPMGDVDEFFMKLGY